jgi:formate hydrogenlyase subunit 3/multisubunit Na+/H+ antiporter MnhD subunit
MISVTLCFMGAVFGIFALVRWFCILKPDVHTDIYSVIPIVVTTIVWLSAAVTLYQTSTHASPIDIQRFFMALGVAGLIWRIKVYSESSHKKDAIIKAQRDTINHLTAK